MQLRTGKPRGAQAHHRRPRCSTSGKSRFQRRWASSVEVFQQERPLYCAALALLDPRLRDVPFSFVAPRTPGATYACDATAPPCRALLQERGIPTLATTFAVSGVSHRPGFDLIARIVQLLAIRRDSIRDALAAARRGATELPQPRRKRGLPPAPVNQWMLDSILDDRAPDVVSAQSRNSRCAPRSRGRARASF